MEVPFVNPFDLREESGDDDNDLSDLLRPFLKSVPESCLNGLDSAQRAELADSLSIESDEPISLDEERYTEDVVFVVGAEDEVFIDAESGGDYDPLVKP